MTAPEFLATLARRGVSLVASGDRLRCSGPPEALTEDLLAAISARKPELLSLLAGAEPAGTGAVERPLSWQQERLWLLQRIRPASTAYSIPLAVRLRGRLQPAALDRATGRLRRRHEVLRTTYRWTDAGPVQRVAPPAAGRVPLVDLGGLPEARRRDAAAAEIAADTRRPFDLEAGPALRAALVRLDPGEHVLLASRHHVSSDGWSLPVLLADLAEGYRQAVQAVPDTAPPAPRYADALAGQPAADAPPSPELADYVRSFAAAPLALALLRPPPAPAGAPDAADPTAAEGPHAADVPAAELHRRLPPAVAEEVRALARRTGSTPFCVLSGAFAAVLARLGSQPEVVLGTALAGRDRPGREDVLGTLATVLPLRVRPDWSAPVAALAGQVRAAQRAALAHQHEPVERWLERERPDRAGQPLLDAVFVLQDAPVVDVRLPEVSASVEPTPPTAPKHPVLATVHEDSGGTGYLLRLEYDAARLDRAAAEAVADGWVALLAHAGGRHDRPVRELLARAWPSPVAAPLGPAPVGTGRWLPAGVDRWADRQPDAVAVTDGDARLSYRELARRSRSVAAALAGVGVRAGDLVGVCVPPSADLAVAVLGVLRAGAAYLPLDVADPAERRAAVLADAAAAALLVGDGAGGDGGGSRTGRRERPELPVLPVRRAAAAGARGPASAAPDDRLPAYVIYTSGSTGAPKGVVVSHRNVGDLVAAATAALPLRPGETWSLAHSAAFDFSVWELWGPLLSGGRLVVVPDEVRRDPDELWRLLRRERVDVASLTPSVFRHLAAAAGRHDAGGAAPGGPRLVVLGGEACEAVHLRDWFARGPAATGRVVNMYGITETTVHVTAREMTRDDSRPGRGSRIGWGLPGMRAAVLAPDGSPQPAGGVGEIVVGGSGVSLGYLRCPALTADRFRPDPDAPRPGGRRYRSGDAARLGPHGPEYLRRLDDQVKVRGYRIEPAEVERALAEHPGVALAAVVPGAEGDERFLAAHVVPAGPMPDPAELRAFLAARLPAHAVPVAFAEAERLPLTRNGKLDRAALPVPRRGGGAAGVPPRTATEKELARMWCELLDRPEVGVHDNFFDLGADSLTVMRFHGRLAATAGVELPVRRIYQALDIASLARLVDRARAEQEDRRLRELLDRVEAMTDEELRRWSG